jgi:PleD family two-component response regulator
MGSSLRGAYLEAGKYRTLSVLCNLIGSICFSPQHHKAVLADRLRTLFLPDRNVVFVVDDDPSMLMSVKRLLRANGYDSLLFSSAKAFKEQVDFEDALCVVLDINLEPGSGIELRHGLKAAGNSVPVIYMTSA